MVWVSYMQWDIYQKERKRRRRRRWDLKEFFYKEWPHLFQIDKDRGSICFACEVTSPTCHAPMFGPDWIPYVDRREFNLSPDTHSHTRRANQFGVRFCFSLSGSRISSSVPFCIELKGRFFMGQSAHAVFCSY